MNIHQYTDGSGEVCEDLTNATESGAWVLDGSSGAKRAGITDEQSDGRWYVEQLNDYLETFLLGREPLPEVLRGGVQLLKSKYRSLDGSENVGLIGQPLAAGALLQYRDGYIEYLLSADCNLVIERQDGTIETILGDGPRSLDQRIVDEISRLKADKELTHQEAKDKTRDMIVSNRRELNKPGGYWAFSLNERAVDHARGSTLETSDVRTLGLFTDGFERLTEKYGAATYEELFETVRERGPEPLFETLRAVEEADENCIQHPRIKSRDDAALLVVEFDD